MKFLAINFGGLGDEILFLPTLASIKAKHPDWEITLLVEPRSRSIFQLTNLIDKIICFDIKKTRLTIFDYLSLLFLLQKGKYDIVLSSGSSPKVALLLFLSGIKQRIGYHSGWLSEKILHKTVKLNKNQYAAYMYHDLIQGLSIDDSPEPPKLELKDDSLLKMKEFINSKNKDNNLNSHIVLIHPGTSQLAIQKGIIKNWSASNWCELIKRLLSMNCRVILAGGPDDERTINDIKLLLADLSDKEKSHFTNAYGSTQSVADLAALIELADLIVCVDSAPMHIAAALQKRIVALFGPTDPDKLLLQSDRAIAICPEKENSTSSNQSLPYVKIPIDIVFQTVTDQLNRASVQESSLEFHRH